MKWLKKFWKYLKFLFSSNDEYVYDVSSGQLVNKKDLGPFNGLAKSKIKEINDWAKSREDIDILAISVWSEGSKCDHVYKRLVTSGAHATRMKAAGVHVDYICRKCGHSFCAVVSPSSSEHVNAWLAMLPKVKAENEKTRNKGS